MAVDAINCTNISTDTVTVTTDTNDTNGTNDTNDTNDTNNTAARRLQASSPCTMASVAQVGLDSAAYFHDCTNKAHDEVCIAHCAQGWNMTQEEPSIFVCKSGFLVGASLPTCVPLPCSYSFPDGLGVRHNCLGVRSAESCEATCTEAGYTYAAGASAETWTCLPTGSLDGQVPTCERIACVDLAINTMYSHNCQGKRFEDTCSVGCGPGFTLSGTAAQYQCQADGNITGSLPTCLGNPLLVLGSYET
ncbi:SELP [Symbiodinium natans]|uniref:SELP protein n=1 Tax=Symbiodinium natans TaxID=878477 RepID=A0A812MXC6_9DINO|nr:SELP [Symbiodinium natans]